MQNVKQVSIPIHILISDKITLSAKGLYAFLCAKNDLTGVTLKSLSTELDQGVFSISTAMDQLKDHGLVSFEKNKDGTTVYKTHWALV